MRPFTKCACLVVVVCGLVGCRPADVSQNQVIPAEAAAKAFKEVRQLCRAEGGRLWGRSLCGPMMFADPSTRQAVLNEAVPGAVRDGGIFRLTLPEDVGIANTDVAFAGMHWSMVIWPLPRDASRRHILLMHESYHRIQKNLGLEGRNDLGQNGHLDTKEGRIWLRAELHALKVALASRGDDRRRALRDALLFRAYRRSKWPQATAQERNLELNEGLAESTGIDAALTDPRRRIEAALDDIDDFEKAPSYVRSFAYATGPAYAELLNAVDPAWRKRISRDFDFGRLAKDGYRIEIGSPDRAVALKALSSYQGEEITREENARQKQIEAREARFATLFIDGPVVTFPLVQMSISFNPRTVNTFKDHGRVYSTLEVRDVWGTLDVVSGGALIPPSFKAVIVPAEGKAGPGHPIGEHWTAKLKKGFALVPDPTRPGSFKLTKQPVEPGHEKDFEDKVLGINE